MMMMVMMFVIMFMVIMMMMFIMVRKMPMEPPYVIDTVGFKINGVLVVFPASRTPVILPGSRTSWTSRR